MAHCMDNSIYDLVLGDSEGVRHTEEPDSCWTANRSGACTADEYVERSARGESEKAESPSVNEAMPVEKTKLDRHDEPSATMSTVNAAETRQQTTNAR